MNKLGIWGLAIAAAFVAGTIVTGTVAYADGDNKWLPKGKPFKKIGDFIKKLVKQVADHEERITDLENQPTAAQLYTFTESHEVPSFDNLAVILFCNDGDTVINGYFQAAEGLLLSTRDSHSIISDTAEGYEITVQNLEETDQPVDYVVVCLTEG